MASANGAKKIVTAKDADGNMTTRTIIVEGPVTIAIPTIRNRTDQQLQSRLLVSELPDFPGRVKHHAAAVSDSSCRTPLPSTTRTSGGIGDGPRVRI